jgi:hypothetical protein
MFKLSGGVYFGGKRCGDTERCGVPVGKALFGKLPLQLLQREHLLGT